MFWNVLHIVGNHTIPFTCLGKIWFSSFWAQSSRPIRLQDSSNVRYWWTVWYFFLKLCMKLDVHKCEKMSEPNFGGKFWFCPNWAKMAQKCIYFKYLSLVLAENVLKCVPYCRESDNTIHMSRKGVVLEFIEVSMKLRHLCGATSYTLFYV